MRSWRSHVRILGGWRRLLAALAGLACAGGAAAAEPRPNFIVLLTDDQRQDTLGCYDSACPIKTPHIDRLARDGVRFEEAFVVTPICVASRANILTGRYSANTGVHRFLIPAKQEFFDATYPMRLKRDGYFVGMLGKYGVGITKAQEAEYDFYDATAGQGPPFRDYKGQRLHDAEWLTARTKDFLDAAPQERPFCLQINYKEPHSTSVPAPEDDELLAKATFKRKPSDTPEQYAQLPELAKHGFGRVCYVREFAKGGTIDPYLRDYYEKIVSVDRSVGAIREMLRQRGLADNTVIFFLSDHGTHFGEKQIAGKWTPYEPSLRIPLLVYDPRAKLRGSVDRERMVLNIDIAPTILQMAGVKPGDGVDGRSLAPLLAGEKIAWREAFSFEHFTSPAQMPYIPRNEGLRRGDLKYVRWIDLAEPVEELFDMRRDPRELRNLVDSPGYADQLAAARAAFAAWREANPSSYEYHSYEARPQSLAKEIDWERFKKAQPEAYDRIEKVIEKLGVSWEAAMNDWSVRFKVCSRAGYWY